MELKILENIEIASNIYSLKIDNPSLFDAVPGQFFMVKINGFDYPLLRRPFSIASFEDDHIGIIYKVVGEGTKILSNKKPGDFIDLLGPLGNGFGDVEKNKKILLVGGGIGIVPFIYLKSVLKNDDNIDYKAFFGFNTKDEIYIDFGEIATIDGSCGFKGNVVDMVENEIDNNSLIFACGPTIMLKRLAYLCYEKNCDMQVSLESRMACGIGVCLGCVIETNDKDFKRVCVDGPVFDYKDIAWQTL